MKVFLMLALRASALLASTSVNAHTQPATPKGIHAELVAMKEVKAAVMVSPTAGGFRGSFSSARSSSGGFHSSPSYHSYSASPSRTFTFRSNSPSISTRPATTSRPTYTAPRTTYSAPAPAANYVHHYQAPSGRGSMTATDYLLLNAVMNSGHQHDGSGSSGSTTRFVLNDNGVQSTLVDEDKLSGWAIFGIMLCSIAGAGVIVALIYGLVRQLEPK